MAVAFDAASAAQTFLGVTSKSWSHTASGTNRYVRVCVGWGGFVTTTATATYGGVPMTSIGVATNSSFASSVTGRAQIFEMINPPTGAQTVVVTFADSGPGGAAGSVSYTGVHQTTASGTPVTETGNTALATTMTVTSNTGDMVGDCFIGDTPGSTVTGAQTERFKGSGSPPNGYWGSGQDANGAATVNINWSWSASTSFAHIGANILQAGGGATTWGLMLAMQTNRLVRLVG